MISVVCYDTEIRESSIKLFRTKESANKYVKTKIDEFADSGIIEVLRLKDMPKLRIKRYGHSSYITLDHYSMKLFILAEEDLKDGFDLTAKNISSLFE